MNQKQNNEKTADIFGLAARYEDEERFIKAVHLAVEAGYRKVEIYSPFPIEGLGDILGHQKTWVQWAVFGGGLIGGALGFFMQYFANVIYYPSNIGGRPFNSWPAFIPITVELTILFAALSGFAAFLISCRLPRLHHPIFNTPEFEHATIDNFFLCIRAGDKNFDLPQTSKFLQDTKADSVYEVKS